MAYLSAYVASSSLGTKSTAHYLGIPENKQNLEISYLIHFKSEKIQIIYQNVQKNKTYLFIL
jgi:hypothetical protein